MEVKDALVEMSRLGRSVDQSELRAEESRLKIRLAAIQQLLAWKDTIITAEATLESLPAKVKKPPAIPIVLKPTDPELDAQTTKEHHNRSTQPSVDSRDPPSKPGSLGKYPAVDEADEDEDALPDLPEAKASMAELKTGDPGKVFVEKMGRVVRFLGDNAGKGKLSDILDAANVTRAYLGELMKDARVKHRVAKTSFGQYELTAAGREMYTALSAEVSRKHDT